MTASIICAIFDILILQGLFMRGYFEKKGSSHILLAQSALCAVISALMYFEMPVALILLISWGGYVAIGFFFYSKSLQKTVLSASLFHLILIISDTLLRVILSWLSPDMNNLYVFLILSVTTALFHTLAILICLAFKKNLFKSISPLIPCEIMSILVCFSIITESFLRTPQFWELLCLLVLLYVNVTFVLYSERIKTSNEQQNMINLLEEQYVIHHDYYQALLKNQEETKALWHDMKKYALAASANKEEADSIIEELNRSLDEITPVVDTGNNVLNALLTYYLEKSKVYETDVSLDINVPSTLPVSSLDLYLIIGNLFDNAIEACAAIKDVKMRRIMVKINTQFDMLLIRLSNSFTGEKLHLQGAHHGLGLNNVQRCVEKYEGSMNSSDTDGLYTVTVRLNGSR